MSDAVSVALFIIVRIDRGAIVFDRDYSER